MRSAGESRSMNCERRCTPPASEDDLRQIVRQMNELIMKYLNTMGTNKIPTTLTTFDEEEVVRRFHAQRDARP